MIPFKPAIDAFLHSNQFASGGIMLMALGGIGAALRKVPGQLYEKFLHLFSMTLTITDESRAFNWFKWWFQEQERAKKIRHVDVFTPNTDKGRIALLFPAPGAHWFMYKGRPFRMTFLRSEDKKVTADFGTARTESLVIRIVGRDQAFVRQFVKEIREKYDIQQQSSKLYVFSTSGWWDSLPLEPRPLDSVILPAQQKNRIVTDIAKFRTDAEWYEMTGTPYHRSYLFYGPPGTGKTSFLLGLASYFKLSIYILKLGSLSDESLMTALRQAGADSMIVLEDVDCVTEKREGVTKEEKKKDKKTPREKQDKKTGVTLSGLLNALDGIETPHGSMFFLSTNCIDKLDEALLRPGRVDVKEFLGPATKEQKAEMYRRFFPSESEKDASNFVTNNSAAKTMAEFQEALKLKRNAATTDSRPTAL